MIVGYIRVSSKDQNLARQKEELSKHRVERFFEEKVSGKSMDRPELQKMLDFVREGDTVYVMDFSRLARNTEDLLGLVRIFEEKKVHLVSLKENLDTSTPTGKLMLTMIGAINQFEREVIRERQREGIVIAKRDGKYTSAGRKPKVIKDADFEKCLEEYQAREIDRNKMAEKLGISRTTLYRRLRQKGIIVAQSKEG